MKKAILKLFVVGLLLIFAIPGYAEYITVDESYYVGSRSLATGGITAGGAWATGNPTITWNISIEDSGQYAGWVKYSYTWNVTDGGNLSHIIFEISDNEDTVAADFSSGLVDYYDLNNSNPDMPTGFRGIKFDSPGTAITFYSKHLPMWGDFYAKDGKVGGTWNTAWNNGIGTDPTGDPFTNWIPVPDTKTVPIPSAAWLLGAGLVGLVGIRRRFA